MTGPVLSPHPAAWRRTVTPGDLTSRTLLNVLQGAAAAGVRGDALTVIDTEEVSRRAGSGLGSVGSLPLLDTLLNLPLGCPVALEDLTDREARLLYAAPVGCVEFTAGVVTRVVCVPVTVAAVLVRAPRWREALRKASAFTPLAQQIVVVTTAPAASALWDAHIAGVGIWLEHGAGEYEELLPAQPFVPRYFKAAGWRFAEDAFGRLVGDLGADIEQPGLVAL